MLDFGRFSYAVFPAENDGVVALVNFGLMGNDAMIKISEHCTVQSGKATSIWVAYFEPQALLDKLGMHTACRVNGDLAVGTEGKTGSEASTHRKKGQS